MHFNARLSYWHISVFTIITISCESPQSNKKLNTENNENINSISQLELSDSSKLTHIKGLFYKDKNGHLYERTLSDCEINGADTLVTVEYFNGSVLQYIDPLTFRILGGWYAKDRHFVYYYRPISGGMVAMKIEGADLNTFKILEGQYRYAIDKNHVFQEARILTGIKPNKLQITKDKRGEILKLKSGSTSYTPSY
jgi:hypothetical protein